ncbi:MAG: hypothetical protein Q9179_001213 [Wetmoreana sp. 5 TL-2023]
MSDMTISPITISSTEWTSASFSSSEGSHSTAQENQPSPPLLTSPSPGPSTVARTTFPDMMFRDPMMQDVEDEILRRRSSPTIPPHRDCATPTDFSSYPIMTAPLGPRYHVSHPEDVALKHFPSNGQIRSDREALKCKAKAKQTTRLHQFVALQGVKPFVGKPPSPRELLRRKLFKRKKLAPAIERHALLHGVSGTADAPVDVEALVKNAEKEGQWIGPTEEEIDAEEVARKERVKVDNRKVRARWEWEMEMWRDGLTRKERVILLRGVPLDVDGRQQRI